MKNDFKDINSNDIFIEDQQLEKDNSINNLNSETLIGWSNICFNDTIDYYNNYHNHNKES